MKEEKLDFKRQMNWIITLYMSMIYWHKLEQLARPITSGLLSEKTLRKLFSETYSQIMLQDNPIRGLERVLPPVGSITKKRCFGESANYFVVTLDFSLHFLPHQLTNID